MACRAPASRFLPYLCADVIEARMRILQLLRVKANQEEVEHIIYYSQCIADHDLHWYVLLSDWL
jgi:hypothetical protein